MKVYISADIEGTAGIASWSATNLGDPEHRAAAQEMTLEAVAACQGALDAGATELYVKPTTAAATWICLCFPGKPRSFLTGP